jgi:hypothetical protein
MPTAEDTQVSPLEAIRQYNESQEAIIGVDLEAERAAMDRLLQMPAELIQAPTVVICSIWPERLLSQYFTHGGVGRKQYVIPAGSPEAPGYCVLHNTFDLVIQQEGMEMGVGPKPIMAAQIAVDLIRFWTGDHPGLIRGRKGVGIIKGKMDAQGKVTATSKEIAELAYQQNEFLRYLVEKADELWDTGKRFQITGEHKKALVMLGLDQTQHPWFRSKVQTNSSCPLCTERIPYNVRMCKFCNQDLVRYFAESGEDTSNWPTIAKDLSMGKTSAFGKAQAPAAATQPPKLATTVPPPIPTRR